MYCNNGVWFIAPKYSLSNTVIVSVKSLSLCCLHGNTCKEYTILTLLAMYRRLYGINVVVFTNDTFTMRVAKEFGFIEERIIHHNEYGLPFLKYLFLDAMKVSHTRLYTYINADIFVHNKILQAAEAYYRYRKHGVLIVEMMRHSGCYVVECMRLNTSLMLEMLQQEWTMMN